MSWNGTVTCSHCYRTGHNKRKCPRLTEQHKQRYDSQMEMVEHYRTATDEELEKSGEDRNWNMQWHEDQAEKARVAYLKRTKIDLATGKKVTNKAAKAERMKKVTCGYCGQRGHTRRVCQNAKNDYAIYVERTRQVRLEWYEKFKATGMGIGSMVVGEARGWRPDGKWGTMKVTALVTGVNWKGISAHNPDNRVIVLRSNAEMKGDKQAATLDNLNLRSVHDAKEGKMPAYRTAAQTMIPSGAIPSMPDNYLTNVRTIKEVFATTEKRPWEYEYGTGEWQSEMRQQLGLPRCAYTDSSC